MTSTNRTSAPPRVSAGQSGAWHLIPGGETLREVQAVFPEASVVRVGGVAAIRGEKRSA